MSQLYQRVDAPHFDYELVRVPGFVDEPCRGPLPDLTQPYIAFLGAAQTFGRFVHQPYPSVVARELAVPALNLAVGGAGPRFALKPQVLELAQRACLVVVQVFAGRSASCSLFDNSQYGRNTGIDPATGKFVVFDEFLRRIRERDDPELCACVMRELREDYSIALQRLGRLLRPPTVLLWMSRRAPRYDTAAMDRLARMQEFPQIVDDVVIEQCRPCFSAYVECISTAGIPQRLWAASEPVLGTRLGDDGYLYNDYYPSPELHAAAAQMLTPVCQRLLENARVAPQQAKT